MSISIKTIHDNFIPELQDMEAKLNSALHKNFNANLPTGISIVNIIDTYFVKLVIDALHSTTVDSDISISSLVDSFNSFNIDLTFNIDPTFLGSDTTLGSVQLDANDVKDINEILKSVFDKDDNRCLKYTKEDICNQDNLCVWTDKRYKLGNKSGTKRLSFPTLSKECKSIMKRDGNMRMRLNKDQTLQDKYDALIRILDNKQKDGDMEHIGLMYKYYYIFYKHIIPSILSNMVSNDIMISDKMLLFINRDRDLKKLYKFYITIKKQIEMEVLGRAEFGALGRYKKHKTKKRKTKKRKTKKRKTQKRKTQKRAVYGGDFDLMEGLIRIWIAAWILGKLVQCCGVSVARVIFKPFMWLLDKLGFLD